MNRRRANPWRRIPCGAGAAVILGAAIGCGGVQVGRDPETPTDSPPAEHTEIPQSGYEDWPDDTVPLVTVDLERQPPAPADEDSEAEEGAELRENPETTDD